MLALAPGAVGTGAQIAPGAVGRGAQIAPARTAHFGRGRAP
jgi:hypothetical protein